MTGFSSSQATERISSATKTGEISENESNLKKAAKVQGFFFYKNTEF